MSAEISDLGRKATKRRRRRRKRRRKGRNAT
jgi:hypothetical protein